MYLSLRSSGSLFVAPVRETTVIHKPGSFVWGGVLRWFVLLSRPGTLAGSNGKQSRKYQT